MLYFDKNLLRDKDQASLINKGLRGIEKESLRVSFNGELSMKPHPSLLGSALSNPYITTDYSEALLEFVTPAYNTNSEVIQFLSDMHAFFYSVCDEELLWPQSMPCDISNIPSLPIANYGTSNLGLMKSIYRHGLGHRYGKAMQLISGVHFNYSLPLDFWPIYRENKKSKDRLRDFISIQYMSLMRNFSRISWIFIYLFGASPIMPKSYNKKSNTYLKELDSSSLYGEFSTSLRMSDIGYSNKGQSEIDISINSLDSYIEDLSKAIKTPNHEYSKIGLKHNDQYKQLNINNLQIENEYYSFVRPKAIAINDKPLLVNLRKEGVGFVEIRTADINMMEPIGVNQHQLRFTEAALLYCLFSNSKPISSSEKKEINERNLLVSQKGRFPSLELIINNKKESLKNAGLSMLDQILDIGKCIDSSSENDDYADSINLYKKSFYDSRETPSAKILEEISKAKMNFLDFTLYLSQQHSKYFKNISLEKEKFIFFKKEAEKSILASEKLEKSQTLSFNDYLEKYYKEI